MHLPVKLYTEPKLSPHQPEPHHLSIDWYVWFRFFDASTGKWIQKRYKKGINEFHSYKERLVNANALKAALREELKAGWNPLTNDVQKLPVIYTVTEAIDYILKIKATTLKTKTKYAYTYICKLFTEWLEKYSLSTTMVKNFTEGQAQQYMDYLLVSKGYSGRTFNDHLIVLRTFFNCFTQRKWITDNPFQAVKREKVTVGRNMAYTDFEKAQVEKELYKNHRRLYYFTKIMFHCFIRRTEMTFIQVKHVDLINKTIIIPGDNAKNGSQESVVIPLELEPILAEMQLHKFKGDDYLFGRGFMTNEHRYKNPNMISTKHNDVVKSLGIDQQKGLYSWKHTGVCHYYYGTNKDIYAIMRQLRHRDMNTTMIYLKSLGLIQNDAFRNARVA